jgi:hypothetical protein
VNPNVLSKAHPESRAATSVATIWSACRIGHPTLGHRDTVPREVHASLATDLPYFVVAPGGLEGLSVGPRGQDVRETRRWPRMSGIGGSTHPWRPDRPGRWTGGPRPAPGVRGHAVLTPSELPRPAHLRRHTPKVSSTVVREPREAASGCPSCEHPEFEAARSASSR